MTEILLKVALNTITLVIVLTASDYSFGIFKMFLFYFLSTSDIRHNARNIVFVIVA